MSAQFPTPPYNAGLPTGFPPPRPRRRRPSKWWFAVGTALLVGSVAAGIGLFIWTLTSFLTTDATVSADGQPHQVTLPDDRERMLWGREGFTPDCVIVDNRTGEQVSSRPLPGSFTKQDSSGDWVGVLRFDPGSVHITATCTEAGGEVQIGRALQLESFFGGVVLTILLPLLLGVLGLLVLIITTVLYATGRPRDEPNPV